MLFKARIFLKVVLTKIFMWFPRWISDENHTKLLYWCMFGRLPDLKNPRTFNEWICAHKIKDEWLDYRQYADKYEARTYVRESIGEQYLNEVLGVYSSFDDIDFNALPTAFVMKGTHGSRYNILVPDKHALDVVAARKKFNKWLKENFYYKAREKQYKLIQPRIMIDRFLKPQQGEIEEFKLFCFHGKVKMISYNQGEGHNRKSNLFDEQWQPLPVRLGYRGFPQEQLPQNKEQLVLLAEKLAQPFEFVRVDLYHIDGTIYFSELTFSPGGGLVPFKPKEFDRELGKWLGL